VAVVRCVDKVVLEVVPQKYNGHKGVQGSEKGSVRFCRVLRGRAEGCLVTHITTFHPKESS